MALTTEQVALWKRNAVMSWGRTSSIALKIMLARIIALADEVLACREAQPVAWSFPGSETESRQLGYDDELDSEQKRNCIPLYTAPPAPAAPDEYRHLKNVQELYHSQEERLFALAQRIKGASFDKYSHTTAQAIDVLEREIFGDDDNACRAAMLDGYK
jgi:hypothetical protein